MNKKFPLPDFLRKHKIIESFLDQVIGWGNVNHSVRAILLVGSYARDEPGPESDVDLVILAGSPEDFLEDPSWLKDFGEVKRSKGEDWGRVQSLRVWFANSLEVEFGFTEVTWLAKPLDPGTRQVLSDGYLFLLDKQNYSAQIDF